MIVGYFENSSWEFLLWLPYYNTISGHNDRLVAMQVYPELEAQFNFRVIEMWYVTCPVNHGNILQFGMIMTHIDLFNFLISD